MKTTHQYLRNTAKVIRGKHTALDTATIKIQKYPLSFLETKEKMKLPKESKRKFKKIKAKYNELGHFCLQQDTMGHTGQ